MISPRRTFVVALLGYGLVSWNGTACSQAPQPAAGSVLPAGTLDAAGAASNSASLPPPAPLPPGALPSLPGAATSAAPGLPPLPPPPPPADSASGLPPLPPPGAPTGAQGMPPLPPPSEMPQQSPAHLQGAAAPLLTLPGLPSAMPAVSGAPVSEMPAPSGSFAPNQMVAPPVSLPQQESSASLPPVALPSETVPNAVPGNPAPVAPAAQAASVANYESLALQRHQLPRVQPSTPLLPAPSVAESVNQKRQMTTLPGSGGDTNYAYATIGGVDGPPRPMMTPPTVIGTVQGTDIGKDYPPLQAIMPRPVPTPARWDEAQSAFATPVPAQALNYYISKTLTRNPDDTAVNTYTSLAEIIVLRGGQEFQGLILERGDLWKIELPNGTVINVPGNKISHVKKLLAAPTHTPGGRSMTFPPQAYFEEHVVR